MWPNPQFPEDLDTFTEEIPNGNLQFLCSDSFMVNLRSFQGLASDPQWLNLSFTHRKGFFLISGTC